MHYKYRVYVDNIRDGREYGKYLPDQYNEAKAKFDELISCGHDAIYLQELNPEFGWVERNIEEHITESFKERKASYWKYREEEDESTYWRAGDAPWNAPGMSIRDFI